MDGARKRASYAEYLALEAVSEGRHAFFDGAIVAMSGCSFAHSRIATNSLLSLARAVASPCQVFNSDLRIRVQ